MSTIARSIEASSSTRTLMLSTCSRPKTRCTAVRSGMKVEKSGFELPKPLPTLARMPMTSNG